jgi:hypothetical protein
VTVISGTLHMGVGDKLDRAKTSPLSTGSVDRVWAHWRAHFRRLECPIGRTQRSETFRGGPAADSKTAIVTKVGDRFAPVRRARIPYQGRTSTLDHPHICSVYEVGEADGRQYIAMQYVEGERSTCGCAGHRSISMGFWRAPFKLPTR